MHANDLRSRIHRHPPELFTRRDKRPPPVDTGERLATIRRSDSEELRVSWAEYEGHHFLSLRMWTQDIDGDWWPDKTKGCTVRPRDLPAFAEGIAKALDKLGG